MVEDDDTRVSMNTSEMSKDDSIIEVGGIINEDLEDDGGFEMTDSRLGL